MKYLSLLLIVGVACLSSCGKDKEASKDNSKQEKKPLLTTEDFGGCQFMGSFSSSPIEDENHINKSIYTKICLQGFYSDSISDLKKYIGKAWCDKYANSGRENLYIADGCLTVSDGSRCAVKTAEKDYTYYFYKESKDSQGDLKNICEAMGGSYIEELL